MQYVLDWELFRQNILVAHAYLCKNGIITEKCFICQDLSSVVKGKSESFICVHVQNSRTWWKQKGKEILAHFSLLECHLIRVLMSWTWLCKAEFIYIYTSCLNSKNKFWHFITSYSRDRNVPLAVICKTASVFWMLAQVRK